MLLYFAQIGLEYVLVHTCTRGMLPLSQSLSCVLNSWQSQYLSDMQAIELLHAE